MTSPEVIELSYADEETVTEWYVRGHVDDAAAVAAVQAYLEEEVEEDSRETVPALAVADRTFARWGLGMHDGELANRRFYCDVKKSPGAFPVTVVIDLDDREHTKAQKQAQAAREAEIEMMIRGWLPEASEIKTHGYPLTEGTARFSLPLLQHPLTWDARQPSLVTIALCDVGAWTEHYKGRPGRPLPRGQA